MPVIERRPMPRSNARIHPRECGLNSMMSSSLEGARYEVETNPLFLAWLRSSRYTVGEVMDALSSNGSMTIDCIGGLTLGLSSETMDYGFHRVIVMRVSQGNRPAVANQIEPDAPLRTIYSRLMAELSPAVQLSPMPVGDRPESGGTPRANGPFPNDAVVQPQPDRPIPRVSEFLNLTPSRRKVTINQPELCDRFAMLTSLSDYGTDVAEVKITLRDGSTRTLMKEGILDEVVIPRRRSEPFQVPPADEPRNAGWRYGSRLVGREEVPMASLSLGEAVWVDEAPQSFVPSFDQILATTPSSSEDTHES